MQVVDLNHVAAEPRGEGLAVAFPVNSATGAAASATVWIELDPGGEVPEHTDSAEELLFVVRGEVAASVGGETGVLSAGQLALVPAMAPHSLRNLGDRDARVLGFFAGSTNVATFTEPQGPGGEQMFVIGGPRFVAVPLQEVATLTA
jgi:quercetin dioxygenase-like cupin family protein